VDTSTHQSLSLNETGTAPSLSWSLWSRRANLNSPKNGYITSQRVGKNLAQGKNCSEQDLDQVARNMIDVKGMDEDMVTWVRAIEALPVVSLLILLTKKSRFRVTLRCYKSCKSKRCGLAFISTRKTRRIKPENPYFASHLGARSKLT